MAIKSKGIGSPAAVSAGGMGGVGGGELRNEEITPDAVCNPPAGRSIPIKVRMAMTAAAATHRPEPPDA